MKPYGLNELRKMYLDFFESKGHLVMKSFSLIPQNDKSLLLINAGMAPLKPYFTGQEIPPRNRVATCQKLSSLPKRKIRSFATPISLFQISNASSSSSYTEGYKRSSGISKIGRAHV